MVDQALDWGLEVIRAFQSYASPVLTEIVRTLTLLGSEWLYLGVAPVLYWCVDSRRGSRIGVVGLISSYTNICMKDLTMVPRPYVRDPSVMLSFETTSSFPSGHAQNSAAFWSMIAGLFRRPILTVLAIVLPLLIGLTRIYLGVHYPTDVVVGWIAGYGIAGLYFLLGPRVEKLLDAASPRAQAISAAAAALLMNFIDIRANEATGAFLGFSLGLILTRKMGDISAAGKPYKRVLRAIVGFAGMAILYFGVRAIEKAFLPLLPEWLGNTKQLAHFLRYGLIGLWASWAAPTIFIALGLSVRPEAQASIEGTV